MATRSLVGDERPDVRKATHEMAVAPRSVYLIAGQARSAFEHHIPALTDLRYSITFRPLR